MGFWEKLGEVENSKYLRGYGGLSGALEGVGGLFSSMAMSLATAPEDMSTGEAIGLGLGRGSERMGETFRNARTRKGRDNFRRTAFSNAQKAPDGSREQQFWGLLSEENPGMSPQLLQGLWAAQDRDRAIAARERAAGMKKPLTNDEIQTNLDIDVSRQELARRLRGFGELGEMSASRRQAFKGMLESEGWADLTNTAGTPKQGVEDPEFPRWKSLAHMNPLLGFDADLLPQFDQERGFYFGADPAAAADPSIARRDTLTRPPGRTATPGTPEAALEALRRNREGGGQGTNDIAAGPQTLSPSEGVEFFTPELPEGVPGVNMTESPNSSQEQNMTPAPRGPDLDARERNISGGDVDPYGLFGMADTLGGAAKSLWGAAGRGVDAFVNDEGDVGPYGMYRVGRALGRGAEWTGLPAGYREIERRAAGTRQQTNDFWKDQWKKTWDPKRTPSPNYGGALRTGKDAREQILRDLGVGGGPGSFQSNYNPMGLYGR